MNETLDMTTVVFAILAIFVVWKLRSVLGSRTGTERPPFNPFRKPQNDQPKATSDALPLPSSGDGKGATPSQVISGSGWEKLIEEGSGAMAGLVEIANTEPNFDAKQFVDGAKGAYEMIVVAFAAGDRTTLRNLLAKDVFDSFVNAIGEREKRVEKVDMTFVSIDKALIVEALVRGKSAQISVRFASKLISATRDAAGNIIDGNADKVVDMIDLWTFARDLGARDPNWKLVATDSGH